MKNYPFPPTIRVLILSALPLFSSWLETAAEIEVVGTVADLWDDYDDLIPPANVLVIDLTTAPAARLARAEILSRRFEGVLLIGSGVAVSDLARELAGHPWAALPLDSTPEQLAAAIRAVASGLSVAHPRTLDEITGLGVDPTSSRFSLDEELTARETEVLGLVALGLGNRAVAERLGISEHTVKFHVGSIMAKLGATSRTEAVYLASRKGIVPL